MSAQPVDLDAVAAWFEDKTQHSSLDDLGVIAEWQTIRDVIAEVLMLRGRLARVTLLAGHDATLAIDGTRWIEARKVFLAATGNDGEVTS